MKQKKIPMRTCVVTREKYPKKELIRVVRTPEGNVEIDTTGKANGKGAYLKLAKEVIDKARLNKALDRALDKEIPHEIYDELEKLI
mgnify:CR=1 FL=1